MMMMMMMFMLGFNLLLPPLLPPTPNPSKKSTMSMKFKSQNKLLSSRRISYTCLLCSMTWTRASFALLWLLNNLINVSKPGSCRLSLCTRGISDGIVPWDFKISQKRTAYGTQRCFFPISLLLFAFVALLGPLWWSLRVEVSRSGLPPIHRPSGYAAPSSCSIWPARSCFPVPSTSIESHGPVVSFHHHRRR